MIHKINIVVDTERLSEVFDIMKSIEGNIKDFKGHSELTFNIFNDNNLIKVENDKNIYFIEYKKREL